MMPRRWARQGIAGLVIVVAVAGTALTIGPRLRSPKQVAADAAPPPASLVTAKAEMRSLAEAVVLRGRVKPGPTVKLTAPSALAGPDAVVTFIYIADGNRLRNGQILAEVANQPLFALVLPFPLFRDLTGGVAGRDVSAVQNTLRRLGFATPRSGVWDAGTQAAVSRFYRARGYRVPSGDQATLIKAKAAADAAQAAYDRAVATNTGVAAAKADLDAAKSALTKARLAAGPALPRSNILRISRDGQLIAKVKLKVGSVLSSPEKSVVAEVGGGIPYVSLVAAKEQVDLITTGLEGKVVDEISGNEARVKVVSIGVTAVTEEGNQGFPVELAFVGKPLTAIDRSVRVDFLTSEATQSQLAVPVTAIYSRTDGTTFVTVVGSGGETTDVSVTVRGSAGGWAAINPSAPGGLGEGSTVVIGSSGADAKPGER